MLEADAPGCGRPTPGEIACPEGRHGTGLEDRPGGPAALGSGRRGIAQEGRERRKLEIRSVMRILRGQLADPSPEERLWLAVIEFAVRDAFSAGGTNPHVRADARRWLDSDHFAGVAAAIGLDPIWARDKIRRLPETP